MYAIPRQVGRKMQYPERITLPMAEGTTAKIDAALTKDEVRLGFIREAIEEKLSRRSLEREKAKR